MRKIVVVEHLSLDGVMQAPGRPDEDPRGGFAHGGWAAPNNDDVMGARLSRGMGGSELLFGRRTYEQMYAFWPKQTDPNPFTEVLNNTRKYVVTTSLPEPLPWQNSTRLAGDPGQSVAALKAQPGPDLAVMGSGELVRALAANGLVDEYLLMIHPLVLGSGRRLFPDDGPPYELRLVESVPTTKGVLIATYRPDGSDD